MWEINKYNDCISEDGKIICESPHFDEGKELFKKHSKLIAAAPDLLEALRSIENDDGGIPETIWKMRNDAIYKTI
ncbi:MAG: hypothetical protein ABI366_11040 [Ginsengibacter sp.]